MPSKLALTVYGCLEKWGSIFNRSSASGIITGHKNYRAAAGIIPAAKIMGRPRISRPPCPYGPEAVTPSEGPGVLNPGAFRLLAYAAWNCRLPPADDHRRSPAAARHGCPGPWQGRLFAGPYARSYRRRYCDRRHYRRVRHRLRCHRQNGPWGYTRG